VSVLASIVHDGMDHSVHIGANNIPTYQLPAFSSNQLIDHPTNVQALEWVLSSAWAVLMACKSTDEPETTTPMNLNQSSVPKSWLATMQQQPFLVIAYIRASVQVMTSALSFVEDTIETPTCVAQLEQKLAKV